ncbi:MAG TPA: lysine-sensitive aspartokinase 3 [Pyrinomonadaceae bacterium]|nr:lysine-sensitive aspartokinase 3 [Pyrinomonadaceae bacterium]
MKFGGTSVGNSEAFQKVSDIVASQSETKDKVVVVSAMRGVTDALISAFETAKAKDPDEAFQSLEPHFERHIEVADKLVSSRHRKLFDAELDYSKKELNDLLRRTNRRSLPLSMLKDAIVSYGEQLSSRLLACVLESREIPSRHIDARRVIVTDDEFGSAEPLWEETEELINLEATSAFSEGRTAVIGGFIGANRAGETTTLGRGGSDFSASIVAAAINAGELQIWTDVSGVMTCDPRICPEARPIPSLSYEEAAELAYFGAKVLHPKTIKPAVDKQIPVRVCNTFDPLASGTLITAHSDETPNLIKSIAHKSGITILRITSARMLGAYGFMSAVFQVFDRHRVVIDVISTSEVSVAMTIDNAQNLDRVVEELKRLGEVVIEPDNAVVCVVGEGLRASKGLAAKIFSTISDINIALVSHGASEVNLTFVVRDDVVSEVIRRLHKEFF